MGNSYSSLYIHAVWSTKYREPLIKANHKMEVEKLMVGIAKDMGAKPIETFAMPEHIHMLICIPPTLLICHLIGEIKRRTSRRINQKYGLTLIWQRGYAVFSLRESNVPVVQRYIQRQFEHHKAIEYKEEYLKWLDDHNVEYDMKYVFDD